MDEDDLLDFKIWDLYYQCYECGYSWPIEDTPNPWIRLYCNKCGSGYTGEPTEDIWEPCQSCRGSDKECDYCSHRKGFVTRIQRYKWWPKR